MLKRGTINDKKEISSKEFTKQFIKNFILNGLVIGIILAIIDEGIKYFVSISIIKEFLYLILTFFAINQIYIEALKDTFYDSYIFGKNIRKAKKNIVIIFIIIALLNILLDSISLIRLYTLLSSLGSLYLKTFIIKNIIYIVLYLIIIILCRDTIDKECSEFINDTKHYLIKKIILILVYAITVIIGIVFVNLSSNTSIHNNNATTNHINENSINNTLNTNISTQKEGVNVLQASSIYGIICTLSSDTIQEYGNVRKDYLKTDGGNVEINISAFDTNIQKSNIYNMETVTDGIILCYLETDRNCIEKFDMNGNSVWKRETSSSYKFYDLIEVIDGYFMSGLQDDKQFIAKFNMIGNIISAKYIDENISDITLIESDANSQKGYLEIIGRDNNENAIIIRYNNLGEQESISNTSASNIAFKKVVEKNGDYYGIGADSTVNIYRRENSLLFKIDKNGNEIFKYDIQKNEAFLNYIVGYNNLITDISVNDKYIFIIVANDDDVFALDLNGNLKEKFGYDTNTALNKGYNSNLSHVKATNSGVYIYGTTAGINIDMISNEFIFQKRLYISNTQLLPVSTTVNSILCSKLLENKYLDATLYDTSSIIIYQYGFK